MTVMQTETSPATRRRAVEMDRIDRNIVTELQRDATLSIAELADRVGLSQTPCWKRIRKLESAGVLNGRVALADPAALGLDLTAFVEIATNDHSPAWRDAFARVVTALPEVMEVHRMAGDVDYLLKVTMPDMAAFDGFYKRLTDAVPVRSVTSRFSMERMKFTTAYPVPPARADPKVP